MKSRERGRFGFEGVEASYGTPLPLWWRECWGREGRVGSERGG